MDPVAFASTPRHREGQRLHILKALLQAQRRGRGSGPAGSAHGPHGVFGGQGVDEGCFQCLASFDVLEYLKVGHVPWSQPWCRFLRHQVDLSGPEEDKSSASGAGVRQIHCATEPGSMEKNARSWFGGSH